MLSRRSVCFLPESLPPSLLGTLQRRFGIQQAIFVFDNGMSSTINLEAMREEELHFVTRLSSTTLRELIAQLPQDAQPQLWDRTKLLELSVEGKRYVIAGGEYRQKRDFDCCAGCRPFESVP
jgi:transposase